MKKILYFVLAVASAALVASCGGGASAPGEAAKQYAGYMADGNYDKFIDGIYVAPDAPAAEVEQSKAMLKAMLTEKGAKTLEEKGGMSSVEVLSEEMAEDGRSAVVTLLYTYGNGETSEEKMDMILDGSRWKMELKK